jgi:phosphoenolpyruvate carboxylase
MDRAPDQTAMSLEGHCRERLAAFRARLTDEPRYNPVAQLSFELSRDLEAGTLNRQELAGLIHSLGKASFRALALAAERRRNGHFLYRIKL